jgi:hypothetical protein
MPSNARVRDLFLPNVTKKDLDDWKNQMFLMRQRYYRGKLSDGKTTLTLMQEIYENMKKEFASGEGIWVYS